MYKGIVTTGFIAILLLTAYLKVCCAQNMFDLGMEYLKQKKYSAAADYLGQAAEHEPNNVWARYYYVWSITCLGKKHEAKKWLPSLKSINNTPQYKQLENLLAINKSSQNSYSNSKSASYETSTNNSNWAKPRNVKKQTPRKKTIIEQAQDLVDSEKYEEAKSLIIANLKRNPRIRKDAYRLLAFIEFNKHNYIDSISYFEQAFSNGTKDFDSYFMAAQSCLNIQKEEKALEYFKKASNLNKNDTFVKLAIADLYCKTANYKEASKSYKDILSKDSTIVDAAVGLANVSFAQGYTDEALSKIDEILTNNSDNAKAHFLKANILMENSQYAEAAIEAQEAFKNNPTNMEYESFAGLTLIRDFQIEKGIELLNGILEKNPNNPYAMVALAEAYVISDKSEQAKQLLNKAETIEKISQTCYLLGLIYATENDIPKAKSNYLEYVKRSGNTPKSVLEYANFLDTIGASKEAKQQFNLIVTKHKDTPFVEKAKEGLEKVAEYAPLSRPVYNKPIPDIF